MGDTMDKKTNILLITADQLRSSALSVYGNRLVGTKNLSNLSSDGVVFDNHFTQNPVCSPSRMTIFTGRYPRNHGLRENGVSAREGEQTIARVLKRNNYRTGAFGKMHLTPQLGTGADPVKSWPEDDFGFQVTHITNDSKKGEYLEYLNQKDQQAYEYVKRQGEKKIEKDLGGLGEEGVPPQVEENEIDPNLHQTTWISDRVIDFIEDNMEEPFFAWCSFVDPHHPFDPPEPYASMYDPEDVTLPIMPKEGEMEDKPPHFEEMMKGKSPGNEKYNFYTFSPQDYKEVRARYYGMVKLIDENIGRIVQKLKEAGQYEDTIIIFTSDHGELLGDHGLIFKGPFHYDSLIRVPLIIKGTETTGCASRSTEITQHTDIWPTISELAGIELPAGIQGRSLAPMLNGNTGIGYDFALTEQNSGDWGFNIKTLRSEEWRLTYYPGKSYGELYDLRKDSEEYENLWSLGEYQEVRERLIRKLLDKLILTEDPLPIRTAPY